MSHAPRPLTAGSKTRAAIAAAAAAAHDGGGGHDDDGNDVTTLRERLRLLETDRKAFFESSQADLQRNRAEIRRLRTENGDLKATITSSKRGGAASGGGTASGGGVLERELQQLDGGIHSLTLRLDRLRGTAAEKTAALDEQRHALRVIELESEPLLTEESRMARRIRLLENRLDKSLIKYNEALAIKRTYEQIVKRLREERVGFDNQLAAIEHTLAAKEHDYQELLRMSHDANHAKETAKKALQDFKAGFDDERRAKDRELAERKLYVQGKVDQTQKLERREKALRQKELEDARARQEDDVAAAAAASAAVSGGRGGGGGARHGLAQRSSTDVVTAADEERLAQYEAAFKAIKDATGVADVNELLARYVAQDETHRGLETTIRESQSRIDDLNAERAELTAKLEELRYTGSGQLGSRRIVEEFEAHLCETQRQREANGQRYERLARLLIAVKGGTEHLVEKLALYRPEAVPPAVTDDTAVEVLGVVEQKLLALADEVVPAMGGGRGGGGIDGSPGGGGVSDHDGLVLATTTLELPPYNRRVKIVLDDDGDDDDDGPAGGDAAGGGAGGGGGDDDDDAVLKRDQVKKISANSIQRETKKLRRKKPAK